MRTFLKILKWFGIVLLLLVTVFVITVYSRQGMVYEAPFPDLHASKDSSLIARGEYLVNGPAHCTGCHTDKEHESSYLRGEQVPIHGGFPFELPIGTIYTRNLTNHPTTGIGRLSDGEIARTLRYGVGSDGRAIFDFMPFYDLSDEDLTAIISYLRTIPGEANEVPANELNFLGKTVNAFIVKPMGSLDAVRPVRVTPDTTIVYGEYLANSVANCAGCHTTRDLMTGAFVGDRFAGWTGFEGTVPGSYFNTPNLTPDPGTGHLRLWDFDTFKVRFRAGPAFPESPMPWVNFKRFSDDDLKAIWNYLHSLAPIRHETGPLKAVPEEG